LQNITNYRGADQFMKIDCEDFEEYITVQADGWPRSFQEKEVVEI